MIAPGKKQIANDTLAPCTIIKSEKRKIKASKQEPTQTVDSSPFAWYQTPQKW